MPVPSQAKKVAAGRASDIKMGDEGGGSLSLICPIGVMPSWIVGVSASGIFRCTIKSRFLLAPAHQGSPGKRAVIW